jgi:hypothetical protein
LTHGLPYSSFNYSCTFSAPAASPREHRMVN